MTIQRDPVITFHEEGTLKAVTAWMNSHDAGVAELLKNARRAYAADRANVVPEQRVAVVLLRDAGLPDQDAEPDAGPKIGTLDVGGATLEDILRWGEWQNPDASRRGGQEGDERTQGNGGKSYLYKMFSGQASILGFREEKRNWRGFEGRPGTLERGRPGWIPSEIEGKELRLPNWKDELNRAIGSFGISFADLPERVKRALIARQSFTLVSGDSAVGLGQNLRADEFTRKVARNGQAARAIDEVDFWVIYNGRIINGDKPLKLDAIPAYPGFENPRAVEIPEYLQTEEGQTVSTTVGGKKAMGRLVLYTSEANMSAPASKYLRARWRVTYRTRQQVAGEKEVGGLAPATPGSQFIYGEIELDALDDGYVNLGRGRPIGGPLTEALDAFISEEIKRLAREISERRRHEFEEGELDEVQRENQMLNRWKNRFLPSELAGEGAGGGGGGGGDGAEYSDKAVTAVELGSTGPFRLGRGVELSLRYMVKPVARDEDGKPVAGAELEWVIDDPSTLELQGDSDRISGRQKGRTQVRVRVKGTGIISAPVDFEVWVVDHVLLTPRSIVVKVGKRQRILAEVTNDEGSRATDVLLGWKHSAEDQLVVRITQMGWVSGNRQGRTSVSAGAGQAGAGGCWSTIPVDVEVVPNDEDVNDNEGMPQLLVTDRDVDPATGEVRIGDPDAPALWQETIDERNNVWWLNLQSADAAFAFSHRDTRPEVWRSFHAQKIVEMVAQVHMKSEYSVRGEAEVKDYWNVHKQALDSVMVRLVPTMWTSLTSYIESGVSPI